MILGALRPRRRDGLLGTGQIRQTASTVIVAVTLDDVFYSRLRQLSLDTSWILNLK